jgi:cytochrome c oxidase subunit 4
MTYGTVTLLLLALLAVTFALAHVNLGAFGVAVALLIACVKAALVVSYFMHLKGSKGVLKVAAGAGVAWLCILYTLSLTDFLSRHWLPLPGGWPPETQTGAGLLPR